MVNGVGEEVGVDEDLVGRLESGVVLEEHGARDLWTLKAVSMVISRSSQSKKTHMSLFTSSPSAFFLPSASFLTMFFLSRASRCPMTRLTAANLRVFFWTPIVTKGEV